MAKIQIFKKIATILTGYSLYSAWSWVYDNPLWLTVIGWLGVIQGSILLTLGAMLNNFIFLVMYQKKEVDWLGVEAFEDMKANGDKWADKAHNHPNAFVRVVAWLPAHIFRILLWALRKNNVLAFLVLSIHGDSFIATTVLRGKVGGELTGKDYSMFLASTAFSCTYWSIRNWGLFTILKVGWEFGKYMFK